MVFLTQLTPLTEHLYSLLVVTRALPVASYLRGETWRNNTFLPPLGSPRLLHSSHSAIQWSDLGDNDKPSTLISLSFPAMSSSNAEVDTIIPPLSPPTPISSTSSAPSALSSLAGPSSSSPFSPPLSPSPVNQPYLGADEDAEAASLDGLIGTRGHEEEDA